MTIPTAVTAASSAAAAMVTPQLFRIGMFGAGTVGGGVYEMVMGHGGASSSSILPCGYGNLIVQPPQQQQRQQQQQQQHPTSLLSPSLAMTTKRRLVITKICVRDTTKARDFAIDSTQTEITTDPNSILFDDSIDCFVEVMGGATGLAKMVVDHAIRTGKPVVTANKALLAEHLAYYASLPADQALIALEAAVCGGIPIIHILQNCYWNQGADDITSIQGICNGTTNYMLRHMEVGADYSTILKQAQDLRFAEADPTADVEGHDVRAKIALLTALAFGHVVPQDQIPCRGISTIQSVDFAAAAQLGSTIKLVGTAQLHATDRTKLAVFVSPVVVPRSHLLAGIHGPGNAVAIISNSLGLCTYTGPGAGRYPTAHSIVADLVRIASGTSSEPAFSKVQHQQQQLQQHTNTASPTLQVDSNFTSRFYVRLTIPNEQHIDQHQAWTAWQSLSQEHGLVMDKRLDVPTTSEVGGMLIVCTTELCVHSAVQTACDAFSLAYGGNSLWMPLLSG